MQYFKRVKWAAGEFSPGSRESDGGPNQNVTRAGAKHRGRRLISTEVELKLAAPAAELQKLKCVCWRCRPYGRASSRTSHKHLLRHALNCFERG